ncbi:ACP7 [Symbiodinium sp. CCMP2592]|nr:ACP7 [Symbiodinium sp. CCMP2592]
MGKASRKELKHLTAVLSGLGRSLRWPEALRLFRRNQDRGRGDTALCNSVIRALGEGGCWEQAQQVFAEMQRGIAPPPDIISITSLITACEKGRRWQHAVRLVAHELSGGSFAGSSLCSALVSACAACHQWEQVLEGLRAMRGRDWLPSPVAISAALAACSRSLHWQMALDLHEAYKLDGGPANEAVYGAAVHAAGLGHQWQAALLLQREMMSLSCRPNLVVKNSLLSSLAKLGHWQLAMCVFGELGPSQPDVISFNTAMSACERGWMWTAALQLFARMRKDRVKITSVSCNALLSALEKGQQWSQAISFLDRMQRRRLHNQVSFNCAASACEKALRWRTALLLRGPRPDAVAVAVSISACEKGLAWKQALGLLNNARIDGTADVASYIAALGAAEKAQRWPHALCVLQQMRDSQLSLDAASLSAAVKASGRSLRWQLALQVLRTGHVHMDGPEPDMAFCAAIGALGGCGQWELALHLLTELAARGLRANEASLGAVLDGCQRARQWQRALAFHGGVGLLGGMAAAVASERSAGPHPAAATRRLLAQQLWSFLLNDALWPAGLPGRSAAASEVPRAMLASERVCSVAAIASSEEFQAGAAAVLATKQAYSPLLARLMVCRSLPATGSLQVAHDAWLRLADGFGPWRGKTALTELDDGVFNKEALTRSVGSTISIVPAQPAHSTMQRASHFGRRHAARAGLLAAAILWLSACSTSTPDGIDFVAGHLHSMQLPSGTQRRASGATEWVVPDWFPWAETFNGCLRDISKAIATSFPSLQRSMTMEEFAEMNDELAKMRARLKAARQREQAANAALAELELEMEDERLEMEAEMASLTRRAAALGHDPENDRVINKEALTRAVGSTISIVPAQPAHSAMQRASHFGRRHAARAGLLAAAILWLSACSTSTPDGIDFVAGHLHSMQLPSGTQRRASGATEWVVPDWFPWAETFNGCLRDISKAIATSFPSLQRSMTMEEFAEMNDELAKMRARLKAARQREQAANAALAELELEMEDERLEMEAEMASLTRRAAALGHDPENDGVFNKEALTRSVGSTISIVPAQPAHSAMQRASHFRRRHAARAGLLAAAILWLSACSTSTPDGIDFVAGHLHSMQLPSGTQRRASGATEWVVPDWFPWAETFNGCLRDISKAIATSFPSLQRSMTMEEFAEMNDELAKMRARLKAARQREQAANAALAELELEMEDERLEMEAEMASLTRRAAALGHDPENDRVINKEALTRAVGTTISIVPAQPAHSAMQRASHFGRRHAARAGLLAAAILWLSACSTSTPDGIDFVAGHLHSMQLPSGTQRRASGATEWVVPDWFPWAETFNGCLRDISKAIATSFPSLQRSMTMEEFAEMNDELAKMRARLKAARRREQAANAALAELELEMEDERLEMEAEMASLTRRAAALGHDPERSCVCMSRDAMAATGLKAQDGHIQRPWQSGAKCGMFRKRYYARLRSQISNNELTGKIRHAAALTSWRLLAGVDVVAAQDQPNSAEGPISRAALNLNACTAAVQDVGDVAISWSIPDGNRSELNRLSQVSYARSSADLAEGSSLNTTGSISGPWHGRRWVQAVLRGLEQDLAYRIGGAGGFGPIETRLPSCHWTGQSPGSSTEPATASAAGPLRLAVLGDLGFRDAGFTDQILARIQNSTPDATIQLGDLTWDLSQQGSAAASDFWSKLQPLSAIRPFMPLPGDRDRLEVYQRFFEMSNSSNPWYTFSVGPARFIMLWTDALVALGTTSPEPQRASLAKQQLQWLEEVLKEADGVEARGNQPWVIVAGHRPLYCSLERPTCSTEAASLRSILEPLLVRYRVDLYLASHVHAYERTFRTLNGSVCKADETPDSSCGPVNIVNGDSGEPSLQYEDMPARFTVKRHPGQPGYGELIVLNATAIEYRQLDATTGAVNDQFIMLKSSSDDAELQENFLEAVGWLAFATALVTFTCGFVKWVHADGLKRRDEALRHLRTEIAVLSGMPLKVAGSPVEAQHLVGDASSGLH